MMRYLVLIFCSVFLAMAEGVAQASEVMVERSTEEVAALFEQIQRLQRQVQNVDAPGYQEKVARLKELQQEFEKILVGEEVVELYSGSETQTTLEDEMMNILQPVFGSIKETTSSLREKEDLRLSIVELSKKKESTEQALERISGFQEEGKQAGSMIELLQHTYESRLKLVEAQIATKQHKLDELKAAEVNPVDTVTQQVTSFLRHTGMHLVVAIVVFVAVFFGGNFAFRKLLLYSKEHAHKLKYFNYDYLAAMNGTFFLVSFVFASFLVPVTFLIFNNWLLIGVFTVLNVALFWVLKDKMATIIEEGRLILNIGAVREKERFLFMGLPWIVDDIKFYTKLRNPKLEGGHLRIPITELVGKYSRPYREGEEYFPTSKGDWVIMDDGEIGKVLQQTIEYVSIELLGGSVKTMPTVDFLAMGPVNLSLNGFRVTVNFGIDYKHQADATGKVEKQLEEYVSKRLSEEAEIQGELKNFFVEFAQANVSSLDYELNAEFTGEVAHLYKEIPCYLQRYAVDASNHYGWEIPFTQITVHQA